MKTHKLVAALTLLTVAYATQVSADAKEASKFVKALRQPSTSPDTQFNELAGTNRDQADDIEKFIEEYIAAQARHEQAKAHEQKTHSKFGGKANAAIRDARITIGQSESALKTYLKNIKIAQGTVDKQIKNAQKHLDKSKPDQEDKINKALDIIKAEPTSMPREEKVKKSKKETSEKKTKVHSKRRGNDNILPE